MNAGDDGMRRSKSGMKAASRLAAVAALAAGFAHGAGGIELALPLDCAPGRDCWVVNYVDTDPGATARDYRCGHMTYGGHNGTDFAVRDLKAMADGVRVLAAAAGVVRATRDGEPDENVRTRGGDAIEGRECGNGVRIEHAGGWSTQYCHLRAGSVSVKRGDTVAAGAPLGLLGLSGKTEFPTST
jgi:murein DD-endopeptidase MepM/ murein hydrolase activator NlpD